jgi:Zinc carboxypeptidase/Cytosolic carboxypeptidase N-terminal domain
MNRFTLSILLTFFVFGGLTLNAQHKLTNFEYPTVVDTKDHAITQQEKKVYTLNGVSVDNLFDGARLNSFSHLEGNRYEITITAENEPINPSPWYAFRIYSGDSKTVQIELEYGKANHRYWPKISNDGKNWTRIDSANFEVLKGRKRAKLTLEIDSDKTWVSGQEIINSTDITDWAKQFTNVDDTRFETIGKSKLGRDLIHLDISDGTTKNKEIVAVVSRQHPPEVTGNMAMIAFIEEILNDSKLSKRFRDKYRVLVYPMLNPDGVDLGHWRHNAGGIDLNRDWAEYNQPEIRQICEDIIKKANAANSEVILGLDFHSTYSDVYYTIADSIQTVMPTFANDWIGEIEKNLAGFNARVSASAITSPVSKNWFYNEFKAVGIVYEIGDATPRNIIKKKGEVSAREMMKLLLDRK